MSRGFGEVEVVERLPDAVTAVAGLVTQLGDTWFLFAALGVLLALGTRRRSVTAAPAADCTYLAALVVAASSLTVVLKHAVGLPRPPGAATAVPPAWLPAVATAAYESAATATGYGFPSGHALTTTVVYGGAALTFDWADRDRRLLVAGTAVALVAVSRVVLGVHYVVDVAVGVAVGAAFLGVAVALTDRRPTPALALAAVLAALSFAASGTTDAAAALVATALGLAVWTAADRVPDRLLALVDGR